MKYLSLFVVLVVHPLRLFAAPGGDVLFFGVSSFDLTNLILLIVAITTTVLVMTTRCGERRLARRLEFFMSADVSRFCVCDRFGKVMFIHTEEKFKQRNLAIGKIKDLPEDWGCTEQTGRDILDVFDGGESVSVISGNGCRRLVIRRVNSDIFGRECVILISHDITAQSEVKNKLENVQAQQRVILGSIFSGVILIDSAGKIIMLNREAEALTGFTSRSALGLEYHRIFNLICVNGEESPVETVLTRRRPVLRRAGITLIARSGRKIPLQLSVNLLPGKAGDNGVVVIFSDESENFTFRKEYDMMRRGLGLISGLTVSGYFRYNVESGEVMRSENCELLWPTRNGIPLPVDEWVHKEDAKELIERFDSLSRGENDILDMSYRSNYFGAMKIYRIHCLLEAHSENEERFIFGMLQDITDVGNARATYDESKMLMQTVLDVSPCHLFIKEVSNDYRYVMCSKSWYDANGLTSENVIGAVDSEIFDEATALKETKSDREANCNVSGLQSVETIIDCNGVEHSYHKVKIARNIDGGRRVLIGIAFDVTDDEKAKQREREFCTFYRMILDMLPANVVVKDVDDNLKYVIWNKPLEKQTGYSADQVIGKTDLEIEPYPGFQQIFRDGDLKFLSSGKINEKFSDSLTSAIGREFHYCITKTLFVAGGRRYIAQLCLDMTREKNLENERETAIEKLNDHVVSANMINTCLKRITIENDFESAINNMLLIIGGSVDADRCYIFWYSEDLNYCDCRFEWTRAGVDAVKETMQHVDMRKYSGFQDNLKCKKYIRIGDIANPPSNLRSISGLLESQNIKSILINGIYEHDKLVGFLGIDFVRRHQEFEESHVRTLQDAVAIFLLAYQRKTYYDIIAENAAVQKLIIDMVQIPILLVNMDFSIAHANKALMALSGVGDADCCGMKCHEVICKEKTAGSNKCPVKRTLELRTPLSMELEIDGRDFVINTMPIIKNGEIVQVLESFLDLTEINKGKELLRKAAVDAAEAAKAKSLFIATMSHELRTPLNAVIGFSELMRLGDLDEVAMEESITAIHLAGSTLLNLINDILDLSKLEAGQMKIVPEKMDLAEMLHELHTIFTHKLIVNKLSLAMILPDDLPYLYLDGLRLRQILLNLIGNAVKFTHEGGVEVSVGFTREDEIFGELIINIRDTGIGISQECIDRIFDPFMQLDNRGGKKYQGTGLGLSICRRLVEQMQGSLSAKSIENRGSCFSVKLPNVRFSVMGDLKNKQEKINIENFAAKVLLVDDVAINLKVLKAMATKIGLVTECASDAFEALEKLNNFVPDVVLTDMWMPGMNGEDLCVAIRQDKRFKNVKIIAVTADSEVKSGVDGVFDGVLFKPVTILKLQNAINLAINDRAVAEHNVKIMEQR